MVSRSSWGILVVKNVRISSRNAVSSSVRASCIGAPVGLVLGWLGATLPRSTAGPAAAPRRPRAGSGGERLLDVVGDLLGLGGRAVALDHLAVAADEELGEVPLDRVAQDAALLRAEPLEQGVRVVAVDVDLLEHLEAHAVVLLAEGADLLVAARVLAGEPGGGGAHPDHAPLP